jgi:long-chain acyl-CoA synthetase
MAKPWDFLDQFRGNLFSGEWPTLAEMVSITASRFPDNTCFTTYDPGYLSLTYREAMERVRNAAGCLIEAGVAPGDRVAVSGKNSPEWGVAYLAAVFAGAVVVPLDYQLHSDDIAGLIKAAGAKALFVDEEKREDLSQRRLGLKAVFGLAPDLPNYVLELVPKKQHDLAPRQESDLAAILFTSGTTGVAKGVMLTHRNLVCDTYLSQSLMPIHSTDVFYALLPIHHSYTMTAVFLVALSVGAEIVFGKRMATQQILKDLKDGGITMLLGVPLLFNKLLTGILRGVREKGLVAYGLIRAMMFLSGTVKKVFRVNPGRVLFGSVLEKASLKSIRICISGGGPLPPTTFRQFNQFGLDFVQGYGLTETAPIITLNPTWHYKERSVGKVVPQVEMKILDPDERGVGEIAVRGPMVMQGYYQNEEATREVFTEDGLFRTGDVGYLDHEQYLYLTGRKKSIIVTEGGKNVYPEEIENHFQLFAEIDQILVKGYLRDERQQSEGIEAYVFPNYDYFEAAEPEGGGKGNADPAVIRDHIWDIVRRTNEQMLPYQRIERLHILSEPMEMTTTKKIKRHTVDSDA